MTGLPSGSDGDDNELAQRRERGRLAQRAFRQRQIDTIRELREENQQLKDTIEAISQAAGRVFDFELQAAVQHARQVAGLEAGEADVSELGATSDEGADADLSNDQLAQMGQRTLSFSTTRPGAGVIPDPGEILPFAQPGAVPFDSDGRYSPSIASLDDIMSNGLWFEPDRVIRITHPPADIAPYLGDGMTSLAGALFWQAGAFSFSALRTVLHEAKNPSMPDPHASSDPSTSGSASAAGSAGLSPEAAAAQHQQHMAEARAHVSRVFGRTFRLQCSPEEMHAIMHARLTFRKQGYLPGDHPGRDPNGPLRLFASTVALAAAEGWPLDEWATPVDVETYVRQVIGEPRYVAWRAALRGEGPPERVSALRELVRTMARECVCFGDGPRWQVDFVRETVDDWMKEVGMEPAMRPFTSMGEATF